VEKVERSQPVYWRGAATGRTPTSAGSSAAIAERLLNEGAMVAVSFSRDEERARTVMRTLSGLGGDILVSRVDARDPERIEEWEAEIRKAFGGVDVLVNNAGVFSVSLQTKSMRTQ